MLAIARALALTHRVGVFALAAPQSARVSDAGGPTVRVSDRFASGAAASHRSELLQWLREPSGHPSDGWYTDAVMAELTAFIEELGARIVVVETIWLHRYIDPLRALGCEVILDAHGTEASLSEELAASNPATLVRIFSERTQVVEAQAFAAADRVWIPSHRDAEEARHRYGSDVRLEVVPNTIEFARYGPHCPAAGHFSVVFTASFGYLPNVAASRRLVQGIFPNLKKLVPRARLVLVGRDPTTEMLLAADQDERIEVTGPVDDVAAYLREASAMAVPLVEGHGTRFKVLEAFASRTPVVSSSKGIEGLCAEAGEHYLPAETDAEFVQVLAALASDPALAAGLVERAWDLVRTRYSLARLGELLATALPGP